MSKTLTAEQVDHFMQHGYLRLTDCFSREKAADWMRDMWKRLGYTPDDPSTWMAERINMPWHHAESVQSFAPSAWAAMIELLGGEERISDSSLHWHDNFIVNLGQPNRKRDASSWTEPTQLNGWHVDGDFFTHYSDSPEQALLVIPIFTDIKSHGGATVICPDGIDVVAKHLYEHPEGVSPRMVPRGQNGSGKPETLSFFKETAQRCGNFVEATGNVGDVYLLHPFMLHTASDNILGVPRVITNPNIALAQPFCFNRQDRSQYSIVELKTLRALGRDSLPDWKAAGPRERVTPERERIQARMKEMELRRLQGEHLPGETENGLGEVNLAAAVAVS